MTKENIKNIIGKFGETARELLDNKTIEPWDYGAIMDEFVDANSAIDYLQTQLKEAYEYIDNPYEFGDWEQDSIKDKAEEYLKSN